MKTASVINNPNGQVISLPMDVRVEGDEVFVKRIGESIVLIPVHADPWRPLVESLELFSDDFMESRQQPPSQPRGTMFE
jgi:antitoxin VapB